MRIENLRSERKPGGHRAAATCVWEDRAAPPFEMSFDSDEPLTPEPHAFLLAAAIPAWRHGERRIAIEGRICPRLRDGLRAAHRILGGWYYPNLVPIPVEPSRGFAPFESRSDRAALCLTGGVDSLHLLRGNRARLPPEHPLAFRDAIYALRLTFIEDPPPPAAVDLARRQSEVCRKIAAKCGLALHFLESNFRLLDPAHGRVAPQDQGALLASSGHALLPRIGSLSLAASQDARFLPRWGTHPLLDPNYSSSGLEVRHEDFGPIRFEKLAGLADWDVARRHLLVCFEGPLPAGQLNCGRCEKCLRTMTGLLALGALEPFDVFGGERVTAEKIDAMPASFHIEFFEWLWAPMVEPLRRRGHAAIARSIENRIREARKILAWVEGRDWKAGFRRFDRDHLGGRLLALRRRLGRARPAI